MWSKHVTVGHSVPDLLRLAAHLATHVGNWLATLFPLRAAPVRSSLLMHTWNPLGTRGKFHTCIGVGRWANCTHAHVYTFNSIVSFLHAWAISCRPLTELPTYRYIILWRLAQPRCPVRRLILTQLPRECFSCCHFGGNKVPEGLLGEFLCGLVAVHGYQMCGTPSHLSLALPPLYSYADVIGDVSI